MTTIRERGIADIRQPQTLHDDPVRLGRAAVMPGQWQRHDPFLAMMNDRFGAGAFGPHPHRGFETVTYVLDGRLHHQDNHGGSGVLGAGDVQWMTAGRGVIHDEQPAGDAPVHVLQLWVNLPREHKMAAPRYQDLRGAEMPLWREPGVAVRVFAGRGGDVTGPALTHSPLTLLDIRMQPGSRLRHVLAPGDNGFITVISGSARFGRDATIGRRDDTLWLERAGNDEATVVTLTTADEPLHALLLAGRPLREPVVAHGPFVMSTPQEIAQAVADYQAGRFGA